MDKCAICHDKEPNILFCNCGHIVACKECWEKLGDKKYMCVSCRQRNEIVRNI